MDFNFALMVQVFVLLNPLASFPFLIEAYNKKMDLKLIVFKSVLTAFILAAIIVLIGPTMFNLFGITLDSFRIAGGIVLLLLGISMVRPQDQEQKHVMEIDSLITVIATPMLTGPATISFITIKSYELGQAPLLLNLVGAFLLTLLLFYIFSLMVSRVDPKIVNILSRVLGLFLTAIAIEMIATGMQGIILAAIVK